MSQERSRSTRVALIVGVTGIAGLNLAKKMLTVEKYGKWQVYGISRRKSQYLPSAVHHISCDLRDAGACKEGLASLCDVTHVFYTSWAKCQTEEENCQVNGAMLSNLLEHLPARIQHFVLLTGLKHYIGPFNAFRDMSGPPITPYRESHPRTPNVNFYYTLEDRVVERATERKFTWSIARPNAILGFAAHGAMNLGMSIAVYASICKYANRPFTYPGNPTYYDAIAEVTDASLLAEHMLWEAVTPSAANEAFNVVNGGVFRWRQMWRFIGDYFGLAEAAYPGHPTSVAAMQDELEPLWEEMKTKFSLQPLKLSEISTFWLLDVSLSKVGDFFADMTKSREMGFLLYQDSEKTFANLFDYLRENKFIPS